MNINKIGKISLAVLAAGAFLGLGSVASAQEINEKGWLVPKPKDQKIDEEYIAYVLNDYDGETITGHFKTELYVTEKGYNCHRYSVGGRPFLYISADGPTSIYALVDSDGDELFESKYYYREHAEEIRKGIIPDWVEEKLKTDCLIEQKREELERGY